MYNINGAYQPSQKAQVKQVEKSNALANNLLTGACMLLGGLAIALTLTGGY